MQLDMRVYIVTGASGGVGRHVVLDFLSRGAHIAGVARDKDKLLHAVPEISVEQNKKFLPVTADLTQGSEIERMVQESLHRFKKIDGLIHCMGGIRAGKSIADTAEDEWDKMMALNLKSAFLCSKAVWPFMKEQGGGKIMTISSLAALHPKANRGAYQVSKAGLIALTKSMAEEGKDQNIQVNTIAPSIIETHANKQDMPGSDNRKWVNPKEIAKLCAFLSSDDSNDITGSVIEMPGQV